MVTQVVAAPALTQFVSVPIILRVIPVIGASPSSTTSRGDMEKRIMPTHVRCVTAMDMQTPATTTPRWIPFLTATIRGEGECVITAKAIQVSTSNLSAYKLSYISLHSWTIL